MTNEEKAIELSNRFKCITICERCKNIEDACYKMAKWKDKQILEKVIEWLKENCNLGDYLDWYDWEECRIDTDKLIYDLERAMKGGEE